MIRVTVSTEGLRRRSALSMRDLSAAHRRALESAVGPAMAEAARRAPRDTGRYRRGAAMAANAAGQSLAVPEVRSSRFAQRYRRILEDQIFDFERDLSEATIAEASSTATGVRRERLRKRIERARKRIQRAREELAAFEASGGTAVVMVAGKGRRLTTVRARLYGGSASFRSREGESTLAARNREPHARLVEARQPLVGPALDAAAPRVHGILRRALRRGWARGGVAEAGR